MEYLFILIGFVLIWKWLIPLIKQIFKYFNASQGVGKLQKEYEEAKTVVGDMIKKKVLSLNTKTDPV